MKVALRAWGFGELVVSACMRVLGVCLVALASGLITLISVAYLSVVAPLQPYAWLRALNFAGFGLCLMNCTFNYAMCILSDPGTPNSPEYKRLIAELKPVDDDVESGALLPRSSGGNGNGADPSLLRQRTIDGGSGSGGGSPASGDLDPEWVDKMDVYGWLNGKPYEWGICTHTDLVKPPRSHYDHISRQLVLSMDHFCPWVCNCVGYLNYRYFCLFVFWTWLGCVSIVFNSAGAEAQLLSAYQHGGDMVGTRGLALMLRGSAVPTSFRGRSPGQLAALATWCSYSPMSVHDARTLLSSARMLALAVGLSLTLFLGFHLTLVRALRNFACFAM